MTNNYSAYHQALEAWYQAHGRHELPWRNTDDPYAIYLSEVMLQQTQVKTVLERYYFPFLERFPTLEALAKAPQSDVLKYWQGLGYYNRAINLHKAAQTTAPALPDNYEKLIALPGIGQNTAHAVLAFAFHKPVAILEANVKRVVHRLFALKSASPNELWQKAEQILNHNAPFNYNQAMMDLGSMICTPKAPACGACPAHSICLGKDNPEAYPQKAKRKTTPIRKRHIIVLQDANNRYYVKPRTTRFLNGMYGFMEQEQPQFAWEAKQYKLGKRTSIGSVTQTYSHFQLQGTVHKITLPNAYNEPHWKELDEIGKLPLSMADTKVLKLLSSA